MKQEQYNSSSRLISVTERLLARHLHEALTVRNLNITVEQWRILFYLWKEDGINQQELAQKANKEKSTITRQIDALQKKRLIQRVSHSEDKRNKLIFLTEEGRGMEKEALNAAYQITKKAEENVDNTELEIFKKVLHQIISNIA